MKSDALLVSTDRFRLSFVFSCESFAARPRSESLILRVTRTFVFSRSFVQGSHVASLNKDSLGSLVLW